MASFPGAHRGTGLQRASAIQVQNRAHWSGEQTHPEQLGSLPDYYPEFLETTVASTDAFSNAYLQHEENSTPGPAYGLAEHRLVTETSSPITELSVPFANEATAQVVPAMQHTVPNRVLNGDGWAQPHNSIGSLSFNSGDRQINMTRSGWSTNTINFLTNNDPFRASQVSDSIAWSGEASNSYPPATGIEVNENSASIRGNLTAANASSNSRVMRRGEHVTAQDDAMAVGASRLNGVQTRVEMQGDANLRTLPSELDTVLGAPRHEDAGIESDSSPENGIKPDGAAKDNKTDRQTGSASNQGTTDQPVHNLSQPDSRASETNLWRLVDLSSYDEPAYDEKLRSSPPVVPKSEEAQEPPSGQQSAPQRPSTPALQIWTAQSLSENSRSAQPASERYGSDDETVIDWSQQNFHSPPRSIYQPVQTEDQTTVTYRGESSSSLQRRHVRPLTPRNLEWLTPNELMTAPGRVGGRSVEENITSHGLDDMITQNNGTGNLTSDFGFAQGQGTAEVAAFQSRAGIINTFPRAANDRNFYHTTGIGAGVAGSYVGDPVASQFANFNPTWGTPRWEDLQSPISGDPTIAATAALSRLGASGGIELGRFRSPFTELGASALTAGSQDAFSAPLTVEDYANLSDLNTVPFIQQNQNETELPRVDPVTAPQFFGSGAHHVGSGAHSAFTDHPTLYGPSAVPIWNQGGYVNHFDDYNLVEATRRAHWKRQNADDSTVPRTPAEQQEIVKQLALAIADLSDTRDFPPGSELLGLKPPQAFTSFANFKYSAQQIQMLAWDLLMRCKRKHLLGAYIPDWQRTRKLLVHDTFAELIADLCTTLRSQKTICKRLLDAHFIDDVVDNPEAQLKRAAQNKRLNDNKAYHIREGRRALGVDNKRSKSNTARDIKTPVKQLASLGSEDAEFEDTPESAFGLGQFLTSSPTPTPRTGLARSGQVMPSSQDSPVSPMRYNTRRAARLVGSAHNTLSATIPGANPVTPRRNAAGRRIVTVQNQNQDDYEDDDDTISMSPTISRDSPIKIRGKRRKDDDDEYSEERVAKGRKRY